MPEEIKKEPKPAVLNKDVAAKYDLKLKLVEGQKNRDAKSGIKWTPEEVTVAQVDAMVKAGCKDFVLKTPETKTTKPNP